MLTLAQYRLINGRDFDAVPAALYRAKANARARQLAGSDWLIRDKSDGTHVAALTGGSLCFFQRLGLQRQRLQGIQDLLFQAGQDSDRHRPAWRRCCTGSDWTRKHIPRAPPSMR
jgi:hypothetical protein